MKKYTIYLLPAIILLFSFTFAYAQEGAATDLSPQTDIRKAKPSFIKEKVDTERVNTRNLIQDKRNNLRKREIEARDKVKDKRSDIRNSLQDKRQNVRENIKNRRAERKEKLAEKAKKRILAYVKRIVKRLNAAIDRLEKIAGRINLRIIKLEEKFADRGLDLSEAKRLLTVATTEIAKAREDVSSIEGTVDEVLSTDNPRESFNKVREIIKNAIAGIKNAHKALVEAIKAVKASVGTHSSDTSDTQSSDSANDSINTNSDN